MAADGAHSAPLQKRKFKGKQVAVRAVSMPPASAPENRRRSHREPPNVEGSDFGLGNSVFDILRFPPSSVSRPPRIGKPPACFSQALENYTDFFPGLGKNTAVFSKAWKNARRGTNSLTRGGDLTTLRRFRGDAMPV
jgi:hypothetical protein